MIFFAELTETVVIKGTSEPVTKEIIQKIVIENIIATPTKYSESTSIKLSWEATGSYGGPILYEITYCQINQPSSCKTTTNSNTYVVLPGLKRNFIYNYRIAVLIGGRRTDTNFENIFRTAERGKFDKIGNYK